MWWGGFSELVWVSTWQAVVSLNPHVVGRFFRASYIAEIIIKMMVLIPMWWGGFSETPSSIMKRASTSLNPHVVGRFFRVLLCLTVRLQL